MACQDFDVNTTTLPNNIIQEKTCSKKEAL